MGGQKPGCLTPFQNSGAIGKGIISLGSMNMVTGITEIDALQTARKKDRGKFHKSP